MPPRVAHLPPSHPRRTAHQPPLDPSPHLSAAAAGGEHQRPNGTVLTPAAGTTPLQWCCSPHGQARARSLPRAGRSAQSPGVLTRRPLPNPSLPCGRPGISH
jgi:hypothetical protein